jgi:cytosine/adenosine deaminase-related metal-dependent hydrolase
MSVVFYDFEALFDRTAAGYRLRITTAELSARAGAHRLGILCNLPVGLAAADLRTMLRTGDVEAFFDPALVVIASALPTPLPDRRAFAAAAAIAGEVALFVTRDQASADAAQLAGLQARVIPAAGGLLAGEIDEDIGPTYVLRGRIVTMTDAGVILDGRIAIRRGRIVAVRPAGDPLPAGFGNARQVDTGATLYPGLIDLHNHFVYDYLTLWRVPREYANRDQWPRHAEYKARVSQPTRALADFGVTARAIIRYVEAKALIGGTCTGQGILTRVSGGTRQFAGAMRNVEQTDDDRLPEASTRVPNLRDVPEQVDSFRRSLDRYVAYFYHLSEGRDDNTRRHFKVLEGRNLLAPSLVGVHALALQAADYQALADAGAKIVWSPFSNLLLYGGTLDLAAVRATGLSVSLGCDWSPTGSKNLLEELKVARWCAQQAPAAKLDDEALVRMVTSAPAAALGWQDALGTLAAGKLADLVAIAGTDGDPYAHLIDARERDVELVVVHGVPRYGARDPMRALKKSGTTLEEVTIDGDDKAFYLDGGALDGMTVVQASQILAVATADLRNFKAALAAGGLTSSVDEDDDFAIELDMEAHEADADADGGGLAADVEMAASVSLDTLFVDAAHVETIKAEPNIDAALKAVLEDAYGG